MISVVYYFVVYEDTSRRAHVHTSHGTVRQIRVSIGAKSDKVFERMIYMGIFQNVYLYITNIRS